MCIKKSLGFLVLSLFLLCGQTIASAAEPPIVTTSSLAPVPFRVAYRYEVQEQSETTVSGLLVVAVENHSDQLLRNATIHFADLLPSPFGNIPIDFDEIAPVQMKQLVIPYVTAREEAEKAGENPRTTWQLNYIDINDVPVTVEIPGELTL